MITPITIQKAIYAQLNPATLGVKGIYDNPTQVADPDNNAAFPFITVSDITLREWDDDTFTGFECEPTIHVWSRTSHTLEAKAVQAGIYAALHRQDFAVEGGGLIMCEHRSSDTIRDPDGETVHGISIYRMIVSNY